MSRCAYCFHPADASAPDAQCAHCTTPFPNGWHDTHVTCIALAGATWTGKSVYIGVLVKQLEHLVLQRKGVMRFANDESRRMYEEIYERPLFKLRGLMPPTRPVGLTDSYQRTPLVLQIDAADGSRHHLVIRDVAGEDLQTMPADADFSYFRSADAVIFLFDPCAVPTIQIKLDMSASGGGLVPPQHVLDTVLDLMGPDAPFLGIAISKFDVLQELAGKEHAGLHDAMGNRGAAFFRDPTFTADYSDDDAALLHEEVRSLLAYLEAREITNRAEAFERARPGRLRYFAVSALGDMPEGQHIHPRGIAPFRCTDPVRWAYQGTGVL
jgi:hypothetical protein